MAIARWRFSRMWAQRVNHDQFVRSCAVSACLARGPRDFAVGDLDGDGKPDLMTANIGPSSISIYRNVSSIGQIRTNSFVPRFDLPAPVYTMCITSGDLDGTASPN